MGHQWVYLWVYTIMFDLRKKSQWGLICFQKTSRMIIGQSDFSFFGLNELNLGKK